jgi:hypothetical protein
VSRFEVEILRSDKEVSRFEGDVVRFGDEMSQFDVDVGPKLRRGTSDRLHACRYSRTTGPSPVGQA